VVVCDTKGAIYEGRQEGMNDAKRYIAKNTNSAQEKGSLGDVIEGADVFIGVSVGHALKP
jgi:malate dehydrogenase (oxaloacetate-decarboxylating)